MGTVGVGWGEAIEGYCMSARARGHSRETLRLRRWQLDWLGRQLGHVGPWDVTTGDLERVLACSTWSAETRRSRLSAVRALYRWAHRTGQVDADPATRLAPVKVPRGKPRPCPERVWGEALAVADDRLRLMLLLGAHAGLRASEIARVHSDDLDDDGRLRVRGKGGRVRIVPVVNVELGDAIRASGGWLFPGLPGRPISGGYVTRLVSRALGPGWTAHTLRHRFGTVAHAGTHDLAAVQELLGHASPDTTRIYVLVPDDDLVAAVRAAA